MAEGGDIGEGWAAANGSGEAPEKGFWQWIWEALQGDFKEDRTPGQVAADMAISLIPIVDTICDIRDLCADIRAIRKAPGNKLLYFFLVLTIIGFVPELGSIAKGVIKIVFAYLRRFVKHADELLNIGKLTRLTGQAVDTALPKISEFLSHSHIVKWATKNGVPDVYKFVSKEITRITSLVNSAKIKASFDTGIQAVESLLKKMRWVVPSAVSEKMDDFLDFLVKNKTAIRSKLDEFLKPARTVLNTIAKKLDDHAWVALTQNTNKGWIAPITQEGASALVRKHPPRWVSAGRRLLHKGYETPEALVELKRLTTQAEAARLAHKPYPKLLSADDITTFEKNTLKASAIHGPEKLYRIIDPTNAAGGKFWVDEKTFHSLKSRDEWRSRLAVKPEWNQNGSYVVYEVKKGETLQVWKGNAAGQELSGTQYYLEGGSEQILFEPIPDTMQFGKPRVDAKTGEPMTGRYGVDTRIEFKDVTGSTVASPIRGRINDPHISGPHNTGWGFSDWNGEQARNILVAVPHDVQ